MAGVLSRIRKNCTFSYISVIRKFSSQVFTKPEICYPNEDTNKLSTLFVPGRRGADVYQIVKPVIDVDFIACNLGKLKLSCDHRGIILDLDYVLQLAREWLVIRNEHVESVETDQGYISELHRLDLANLKSEMEIIDKKRKDHLGTLLDTKNKLYDIEDLIMPLFQKIPHILHSNTPLQFSVIDVYRKPPVVDRIFKSHSEIANSSLYFMNDSPISYFMTGKLSQLELAIQAYFMDKLINLGFSPLACVDFCKSFIIEAIGYDPYSSLDSIQIKGKGNREGGQKLHLVGGASFESLCAYFTNMNIDKPTLPYKYFSLGRRYNAANKNSTSLDLFSVVQSTNVHSVILSETDSLNTFDILLNSIIQCYSELDIPYRLVNIAAKNLTVAESHRKQLELWSPALKDYVPVAYVSQHDDFVSKRLQISYGFQYEKEGYCHIVEGMVANIPILIGCIVENLQTKDNDFNVPTVLESYFSSVVK